MTDASTQAPTHVQTPRIRPIRRDDLAQWRPLWDAYNAFYGREGATALPEAVSATTWSRFFDEAEPVYAMVAEVDEGTGDGTGGGKGRLVGLVHYLYHRSTTRIAEVCYLHDLYTDPQLRRQGIGRLLIEAVYREAGAAGCARVYWQTQQTNTTARRLYDQVAGFGGFIVYAHELKR